MPTADLAHSQRNAMKVYERYCDGVKYWCECLGELRTSMHFSFLLSYTDLRQCSCEPDKHFIVSDVSCQCEGRKATRHHAKAREMLARIIRRIPLDADEHAGKPRLSLHGEFLSHLRVITSTLQLIEQAVSLDGACLDEDLIEDVFALEEKNERFIEDDDNLPADKLLGWGGLLGWGDEVESGTNCPKLLQDNHHVKQVVCSGHRGLYVTTTGDVYKFGESGTGTVSAFMVLVWFCFCLKSLVSFGCGFCKFKRCEWAMRRFSLVVAPVVARVFCSCLVPFRL